MSAQPLYFRLLFLPAPSSSGHTSDACVVCVVRFTLSTWGWVDQLAGTNSTLTYSFAVTPVNDSSATSSGLLLNFGMCVGAIATHCVLCVAGPLLYFSMNTSNALTNVTIPYIGTAVVTVTATNSLGISTSSMSSPIVLTAMTVDDIIGSLHSPLPSTNSSGSDLGEFLLCNNDVLVCYAIITCAIHSISSAT